MVLFFMKIWCFCLDYSKNMRNFATRLRLKTQITNDMKRLQTLLIMLLMATATTWARPGYTKPVDVRQPDGTTVTLLMHGDEYLSYMTTTDGYTVVKGADGYYRYALKQDGVLKATALVAKNPELRLADESAFLMGMTKHQHADMTEATKERKAMAANMLSDNYATMKNGNRRAANIWDRIDYKNFKGLVVLVEWNDRKFSMADPQAFYQRLTNERHLVDNTRTHYPVNVTGSARDYFNDQSMGVFDPTFDVVGPVQINYSCEYPRPKTEDGQVDDGFNNRLVNMLKATLTAANSIVDFSNYDLNSDGTIDMVYFIFAGYGSYVQGNNYKYIWPHANDFTGYSSYANMRYDGKNFGRYACSVEIQDYEGQADQHAFLDGIGTICHEFSHVLGLADHYDTDYDENGQAETPSGWDVMAGGADYNFGLTPVGYSAFERHVLGFCEPEALDVAGSYELAPFGTGNKAYIIKTGTTNDEFYIENRQQQGWDAYLPGHGLLAWRVETTNATVWKNNTVNCDPNHQYLELLKAVPARGIDTGYTPFPGTGNVIDLTSETTPALMSWAGKEAVMDLYDITENSDGVISFTAGKEVYETAVEDFEAAALTTGDAENQKGVFCNWTLKKATIAEVASGLGNGKQCVKMLRSSTLTSMPLTKPLRKISFDVWNGPQKVRISLKYSTDGSKWTELASSGDVAKNTTTTLSATQTIPAGAQIQINVLSTSSSAATYIDDIKVTFDKTGTDGIASPVTDLRSTCAPAFNLAGQAVGRGYKGIVMKGGQKVIVR